MLHQMIRVAVPLVLLAASACVHRAAASTDDDEVAVLKVSGFG